MFCMNLRWPLLAIDASGFLVPLRAASCCSNALDSKYSSQAAVSYRRHSDSNFQRNSPMGNKIYLLSTFISRFKWELPEFVSHQVQVLLEEFAMLFVHAEHSVDMLPLGRVQWL